MRSDNYPLKIDATLTKIEPLPMLVWLFGAANGTAAN